MNDEAREFVARVNLTFAMREALRQGEKLRWCDWRGRGVDDGGVAECMVEAATEAVYKAKNEEIAALKQAGYESYMNERMSLMKSTMRCGVYAVTFN